MNCMSVARIRQLNSEAPIRKALCRRAGGEPYTVFDSKVINGKAYQIERVICLGGICECGCGEMVETSECHEIKTRGSGGKISLENSIQVKREHHIRIQNNPEWRKAHEKNIG